MGTTRVPSGSTSGTWATRIWSTPLLVHDLVGEVLDLPGEPKPVQAGHGDPIALVQALPGVLGGLVIHGSTTPTAASRPRITSQYWGSISAP